MSNDLYIPDDGEESQEEYAMHEHEEYEVDKLPPHKRDGYAAELARASELLRKAKRENAILRMKV